MKYSYSQNGREAIRLQYQYWTDKPFGKTWAVEVGITQQHINARLQQLFVKCFGNNLVRYGSDRRSCCRRQHRFIVRSSEVRLPNGTIHFPGDIQHYQVTLTILTSKLLLLTNVGFWCWRAVKSDVLSIRSQLKFKSFRRSPPST